MFITYTAHLLLNLILAGRTKLTSFIVSSSLEPCPQGSPGSFGTLLLSPVPPSSSFSAPGQHHHPGGRGVSFAGSPSPTLDPHSAPTLCPAALWGVASSSGLLRQQPAPLLPDTCQGRHIPIRSISCKSWSCGLWSCSTSHLFDTSRFGFLHAQPVWKSVLRWAPLCKCLPVLILLYCGHTEETPHQLDVLRFSLLLFWVSGEEVGIHSGVRPSETREPESVLTYSLSTISQHSLVRSATPSSGGYAHIADVTTPVTCVWLLYPSLPGLPFYLLIGDFEI